MINENIKKSSFFHGELSNEQVVKILRAKAINHNGAFLFRQNQGSFVLTYFDGKNFGDLGVIQVNGGPGIRINYFEGSEAKTMELEHINKVFNTNTYGFFSCLPQDFMLVRRVPEYFKCHSYYHDYERAWAENVLRQDPSKIIIRSSSDPEKIAVSLTKQEGSKLKIIHHQFSIDGKTLIDLDGDLVSLNDFPNNFIEKYNAQNRAVLTRKTNPVEDEYIAQMEFSQKPLFEQCYGAGSETAALIYS